MQALVVPRFGGSEVMSWQDVAPPTPGPGELLIRTTAFAVNWADLLQRRGAYPGGPQPPFVLGHDLAGVVVGRGPDTEGPADGTRVFGVMGRSGGAAELVAAPAHWFYVVPDGVDDHDAAGLAGPFLTAEVAISCFGGLQGGQDVLVQAAAGGYGTAAVQLARHHGASTIVATAGSQEKLDRVADLGADVLVNYREQDFVPVVREATGGRGVDLVLESVGGDVLTRSFDCLAPMGRLVSVGASAGESSKRMRLHTLFELGISVAGFTLGIWLNDHPELIVEPARRVLDALESGGVRPVTGGVFGRAEVGAAHEYLAGRNCVGRTVVVMD